MKKFSVGGGKDEDVIEFNSFVDMLTLYKYHCSLVDCNELKFWMFNHGLISLKSEEHLKKDTFYIICKQFIDTLKKIQAQKGLTTYSGNNKLITVSASLNEIGN